MLGSWFVMGNGGMDGHMERVVVGNGIGLWLCKDGMGHSLGDGIYFMSWWRDRVCWKVEVAVKNVLAVPAQS